MTARRDRLPTGAQLRRQLDAALAAASRAGGAALEWDEVERAAIDAAVAAADRRRQLQEVYDAWLRAGAEASSLVRLSAELRLCERQIVDMVGKVHAGLGVAKSERHVKAARARWDRRDEQWAAARGGA